MVLRIPMPMMVLHARKLQLIYPVTKENIEITAPVPENDAMWRACENMI
jgi:23S rRNA pseudouridine1911/1915/1917 synthase